MRRQPRSVVIMAAIAGLSVVALIANLLWEFGPGLASASVRRAEPAAHPVSRDEPSAIEVAPTLTAEPEPPALDSPAPARPEESPDPGLGPIRCVAAERGFRPTTGCRGTERYPYCRHYLRRPGRDDPWRIWRNTTEDHRYGRPALVGLILTAAQEYARRWPGERLTVGDLDAPGPRHATHRRGVDVDLYLPHAMWERNELGGNYVDNYAERSPEEVEQLRERVVDLGRILATCAEGRVRIYYNDPPVVERFGQWFESEGLESDVGAPMEPHNDLHRFHFHMTIADDLDVRADP